MEPAIAIIGHGARFPGAPDAPAFARLVRAGSVHVGPVPPERWDHARVHSANPRHANRTPARAGAFLAEIDRFAPELFGITPKRARLMDPQQRLLLEVARAALQDAGYLDRPLGGGRVGVYVGASSADHRHFAAAPVNLACDLTGRLGVAPRLTPEEIAAVTAALPPVSAYTIVGQQLNLLAANVSQAFDFSGPAFALDTACSSALAALHEAVLHLRTGRIQAAIVGGVYVQLDPVMMVCFSRIGALSFTDSCRPFQAAADGFVLGEGVGAVVLKPLADAQRDGDAVQAVIRGIAMNNDGRGGGPLTPLAAGQQAVIEQAWRDADAGPAEAGLIEAHATATPAGDGIELTALEAVLRGRVARPVPVGSIKASLGHGLASAGMASLLKVLVALREGFIPPQAMHGPLRAEFQRAGFPLRVPTVPEPWPEAGAGPRLAGVSGFGFGGTNVHVVLAEAPAALRRSGQPAAAVLPSEPVRRSFWIIDESKRRVAPPGPPPAEPAGAVAGSAGENVERKVIEAVSAVTGRLPAEVLPRHRFGPDLGFDSLTTLELVTALGRSLPGRPPPPRTLFTLGLTVGELSAWLGAAPVAAQSGRPGALVVFATAQHPWLHAHRPGGRAVLPLAALVTAMARVREAPGGGDLALADFRLGSPATLAADAIELRVETADDGTMTVRQADDGTVLATARSGREAGLAPELAAATDEVPGSLPLEEFYGHHAFHGPELRALREVPRVGAATATSRLAAGGDPVVILDGALQLALYWLGAIRGRQAVALDFAGYRQVAPWPAEGAIVVQARLAGEEAGRYAVDFDFRSEAGGLLAQWRGVAAGVLAPAGATSAIAAWPEVRALAGRKAALAAAGLEMPYFHCHDGVAAATTRVGGRAMINFSSYNYLGLAGEPAVTRAAAEALERYGTSAGASRLASGERPPHRELERALADFLACEDAITLVSGHATNVALIGHLCGPEDLVLHDSLAHDCIVSGARLSGARRLVFPHNDLAALAELLERERPKARRALIAVEGVYSMDGDLAPLPEVVALKRRHDALLLLDEAHSLGVLGATGRGAGEHFGVARTDVDFWMGTLSKSLASCGGYVAGGRTLIDYLRFTLPGFVYSVGLPPAGAAAARAALAVLAADPGRVRRLQARSEFFRQRCRERGLDIGASGHAAVVPCLAGTSERALRLAQALGEQGVNVQPIFHPAVEEGKARLRFFVTAAHTEEQLAHTAGLLAAAWARLP